MTQTRGDAKAAPQPKPAGSGRGPLARIGRFMREVVAELGKVIWPTRKELITYTIVVLIFVSIMVAIVSGMDVAFSWGVLKIFA